MAFDLRDKLRMKQKKISFVVFHNNNNTTAIMSPGITISTDRDDHVGEVDHADGVLPLESHGETEAGAEAGDQMNMASGPSVDTAAVTLAAQNFTSLLIF